MHNLEDALRALRQLAALTWKDHLPLGERPALGAAQQEQQQRQAGSGGGKRWALLGPGAAGYEPLPGSDPEAPPSPARASPRGALAAAAHAWQQAARSEEEQEVYEQVGWAPATDAHAQLPATATRAPPRLVLTLARWRVGTGS